MNETDYPSLYQSANQASIAAQKWFLYSAICYIFSLILSAIIAQYAPKVAGWAVISAIILLFTLSLTIFNGIKKFNIIWYNGRAVAESIKTITWRFIMQAEPYQNNQNSELIVNQFINDVSEILKENKSLSRYLSNNVGKDTITSKMNDVRSLNTYKRKEYYKLNRIEDQRNWYIKKAKSNDYQSNIWFFLMVFANALAFIFAILKISDPKAEEFPIEPLLVIAGSILSWMQIKRFQDLATSYNLTAHEIGIFLPKIEFCFSDDQLSEFVKDAENAFSREHTQWVARKDS